MPKARHGWLTPDSLEGDEICRPLFLPANEEVQAIVGGALAELTKPYNYEQSGSVTPEEISESMTVMLKAWYEEQCGTGEETPAPFWETDDAADAAVTGDSDTWYNEISYFILKAFLSTLVSPPAAITFIETVRSIRLAYKRDGFSGIFRVLVDGDVLATIDAYHAGTPYGEFFWDFGSDGEREIVIEHTGDHNDDAEEDPDIGGYPVHIIRQNIHWRPVALSGAYVQYDPETDSVQTSPDGGETWVDTPEQDPRQHNAYPPPDTDNPRCDGAARMAGLFAELVAATLTAADEDKNEAELATVLIGVLYLVPGIDILILAVSAIALLLLEITASGLHDIFDGFDYDELTCLFWRHLRADGFIDDAGLSGLYEEMETLYDAGTAGAVEYLLNIGGRAALNDAAALRSETGDCVDCTPPCGMVLIEFEEGIPDCFQFPANSGHEHWNVPKVGNWMPSGGHTNPGMLQGGAYSGSNSWIGILIDLGMEVSVQRITFWYKQIAAVGSGNNLNFYCQFFDEDWNLTKSQSSASTSSTGWRQGGLPFPYDHYACRYIILELLSNATNVPVVDDIYVYLGGTP